MRAVHIAVLNEFRLGYRSFAFRLIEAVNAIERGHDDILLDTEIFYWVVKSCRDVGISFSDIGSIGSASRSASLRWISERSFPPNPILRRSTLLGLCAALRAKCEEMLADNVDPDTTGHLVFLPHSRSKNEKTDQKIHKRVTARR